MAFEILPFDINRDCNILIASGNFFRYLFIIASDNNSNKNKKAKNIKVIYNKEIYQYGQNT
jgi:hypothetical protein